MANGKRPERKLQLEINLINHRGTIYKIATQNFRRIATRVNRIRAEGALGYSSTDNRMAKGMGADFLQRVSE